MTHRRCLSILFGLLLALPMVTASAQTPVPKQTSPPDITEMPGLIDGVWRTYGGPNSFIGAAQSNDVAATPMPGGGAAPYGGMIDVVVYRFDSPEHAATAFDGYVSSTQSIPMQSVQQGEVTIASEDIPNLGTQAVHMQMVFSVDGGTSTTDMVFVQRDEFILMVSTMDATFEGIATPVAGVDLPTLAVATLVVENGQPSTDDVVFAEDGTSTGGLWGFMPATDSGIMRELQLRALEDAVRFA